MAEDAVAEKAVGINVPEVTVWAVALDGKTFIPLHWEERRRYRWPVDRNGNRERTFRCWERGEILSAAGPVSRAVPVRVLYDESVDGAKDLAGQYAGELKNAGFWFGGSGGKERVGCGTMAAAQAHGLKTWRNEAENRIEVGVSRVN